MKAHRIGQMGGKIGPIVSARVEVKFMSDAAGDEQIVEHLGACFESIIVLGTAIEIDFHPRELGRASDMQRIIAIPE